jgi:Spy/CpxP family protein refolding chaperone
MRSYVKIFTPFLLAVLLGSLTVIFAQSSKDGAAPGSNNNFTVSPPPPPGFGPHGGGLPPQLLEQLDLTDEQISKISTIRDAAHETEHAFFEKVRASDNKLRELSQPDSFNEAQARQVLTAKSQASIELELIRLRTDAAIYDVLTPEQIVLVEVLKQKRPEGPDGFRPPPDGFGHGEGFRPPPSKN